MPNAASAVAPLTTGSLDGVAERLKKARRYAIAVIVAWFAIAISPAWLPTPDSALYLMLGRSLAQGHGYALDGHPHTYVPPGFPYFLAGLERIGLGNMLCLNIAMASIGGLTVWVTYLLISELASRPVAVLMACLLGLNSLLHVMSTLQLSDMPFTLLVLAGLLGLVRGLRGRKWALELGALAILASCWVRMAGAALVVACAVGLMVQPRSTSRLRVAGNSAALLVGLAVTLSIFFAQYQNSLRAEHSLPPASYMAGVQSLLHLPLGALVSRTLGNLYESAVELPRFLTGMKGNPIAALAICLLPVVVGLGRRLLNREFLLALAAGGYAGGIVLNLPAGARYLLPVAPLLLLYYLEGLSILLDWHSRIRPHAPAILVVVLAAFVGFNAVKGVYVFHKNEHRIADERAMMTDAAQCLRAEAHPGELFLSCDNEWPLAYLSEVPAMQIDRWIVIQSKTRDEYLNFVFDQGVRLVVAAPEGVGNYPDSGLFRDAVRDGRMFRPVARRGDYQLYRYLSPPAVVAAKLPPSPHEALVQ